LTYGLNFQGSTQENNTQNEEDLQQQILALQHRYVEQEQEIQQLREQADQRRRDESERLARAEDYARTLMANDDLYLDQRPLLESDNHQNSVQMNQNQMNMMNNVQTNEDVTSQLGSQVGGQMVGQVGGQINGQTNTQLLSQVTNLPMSSQGQSQRTQNQEESKYPHENGNEVTDDYDEILDDPSYEQLFELAQQLQDVYGATEEEADKWLDERIGDRKEALESGDDDAAVQEWLQVRIDESLIPWQTRRMQMQIQEMRRGIEQERERRRAQEEAEERKRVQQAKQRLKEDRERRLAQIRAHRGDSRLPITSRGERITY
jgi:hypothetical protein